jgi:hypothetical protein
VSADIGSGTDGGISSNSTGILADIERLLIEKTDGGASTSLLYDGASAVNDGVSVESGTESSIDKSSDQDTHSTTNGTSNHGGIVCKSQTVAVGVCLAAESDLTIANATTSVQASITAARVMWTPTNTYAEYSIHVIAGGHSYTSHRRFSQFMVLRRALQRTSAWRDLSSLPDLPAKTYWCRACVGAAFLEKRRALLTAWLDTLLCSEHLCKHPALSEFLGLDLAAALPEQSDTPSSDTCKSAEQQQVACAGHDPSSSDDTDHPTLPCIRARLQSMDPL